MIEQNLSFDLPIPWRGERFETQQIGAINFLVGPNGSGKSKFAEALRSNLPNPRILGTDRLSGMEQIEPLRSVYGDRFAGGLPKEHFQAFKKAGQQGSGIDTIVLLEERMDLRIQVEATLRICLATFEGGTANDGLERAVKNDKAWVWARSGHNMWDSWSLTHPVDFSLKFFSWNCLLSWFYRDDYLEVSQI